MILFAFAGVVFAVWFVVLTMARNAEAREEERARAETREVVASAFNLEIAGDPIAACAFRGKIHEVDMVVDIGGTIALPGPSEERSSTTVISFAAALPDQIVCRKHEVDKIMGALPSAPRRPTGNPTFDAMYAVFLGAGQANAPHGYRDPVAPSVSDIGWVDTAILEALVEYRLIFIRVQEGRCEVAFEPRSAGASGPLVATAANIARRASGRPLVTVPPADTTVTPALSYSPVTTPMMLGLGAILVAPLGAVIAFLPPLRALNSRFECGEGGQILVRSTEMSDGTSHGLYCSNGTDTSMALHYVSSVALFMALVMGFMTLFGVSRWPRRT